MTTDYKTLMGTLNRIGVDTRYISLYDNAVYVNNLKFSKFSRKKEEEFHRIFQDVDVVRSKLFQKICIKVSRTVKDKIRPRDLICIENNNNAETILLNVVLEPYKRKYGITITDNIDEAGIMASGKCLNDFTDEYMNLMTTGCKITDTYHENVIYPLMHIDYKWIMDWIDSTSIPYNKANRKENRIIAFLEKHIPNVKESIKQSVEYLDKSNAEK